MAGTLQRKEVGTLQPWLEKILVGMSAFALLATCLRICSRRLNKQRLWWDDWLAVLSMVRKAKSFQN